MAAAAGAAAGAGGGWSLDGQLTLMDEVEPPAWRELVATGVLAETRAFFRARPFSPDVAGDLLAVIAAIQPPTATLWCTIHVEPNDGHVVVLFEPRFRPPVALDPRDGVVLATRWRLAPADADADDPPLVPGMCLAPCTAGGPAAPVALPGGAGGPRVWTPPARPLLVHFAGAGWASPRGRVATLGATVTHDVVVHDEDGTIRRV